MTDFGEFRGRDPNSQAKTHPVDALILREIAKLYAFLCKKFRKVCIFVRFVKNQQKCVIFDQKSVIFGKNY